ncbi:MAG: hypothetical protein AABX30_03305 [Nanoarchaeota archaeon]
MSFLLKNENKWLLNPHLKSQTPEKGTLERKVNKKIIKTNNKKAQVTIFIILAILIVALIAGFFLLRNKFVPDIQQRNEKNPEYILRTCIEKDLGNLIEKISLQGGYVNPNLAHELDGKNISYLCYTQNLYVKCINQEPMLINHLQEEIKINIDGELEACFNKLKTDFEKDAYSVEMGVMIFYVELIPGKINLKIDRNLNIQKGSENLKYENYEIKQSTKLYDLAILAQEIAGQEAEYCNFESVGFMTMYPKFSIDKKELGDLTRIYILKEKKSKEEFKFAIRSCVMPGGL